MGLFGFGKQKKEKILDCTCGAGGEGAVCCGGNLGKITSVKVMGSGCKTCHTLYENVQEAVKTLGLDVQVEYITDMEVVMSYGVMSMPVLAVNDKVAAYGKLLKPKEVADLLKTYEV